MPDLDVNVNVIGDRQPSPNVRRSSQLRRSPKSTEDSDSESVTSSSSSSSKDTLSSFKTTKAAESFQIPSGSASAYSSGGGSKFTLGTDTSFPGRQAGGADRVSDISIYR